MDVLAEFRKGIAHHRAKGATEERIKQFSLRAYASPCRR